MTQIQRVRLVRGAVASAVIIAGVLCVAFLQKKKPNVIIVSLDALRADYLGCYGFGEDTSPQIDEFSRDAVVFTQAISASSHTVPCNASVLTGVSPAVHGVKDWKSHSTIPPDLPVLPEILREHGYTTALVTDQLALSWIKGVSRGLDSLDFLVSTFYRGSDKILDITDWGISWIEKQRNKRFFLWLYYCDPHVPYAPMPPYDRMFVHASPNEKDIAYLPLCTQQDGESALGCLPTQVSVGQNRRVDIYRSLYCGEIRQTDACLGKLFAFLKSSGLDKNTIVIVTSDHGEAMGEHGQYFCHTIYLYDNLIRIPLIVKDPSLKHGMRRVDRQVRSIDIAPTILDFLGLPIPVSMHGKSLKPFMLGQDDPAFPLYAFSEWADRVSVRTQGWKLIYNGNDQSYELYNLAADRGELSDLSGALPEQGELLKAKLQEYRDLQRESSPAKAEESLPARKKELLKSLGYIQ